VFGNPGTTVGAVFGNAGTTVVVVVGGGGVTDTEVGVVVAVLDTGTGGGVTQVALVIVLESRVTAPFCAKTLPSTLTPVVNVADIKAKIFPLKIELAPSVAELPTFQKTLQA